jgi:hypothetical protein
MESARGQWQEKRQELEVLFVYSFTHLFIQQTVTEYLLCIVQSWCWECKDSRTPFLSSNMSTIQGAQVEQTAKGRLREYS